MKLRGWWLLVALAVGGGAEAAGRTIGAQTPTIISTGWGAEGLYVRTVDSAPIADGCGGQVYMIASSHPMLREMMALLLSASQSGSKVDLYVDGCYGNAMNLRAVALIK